MEKKRFTRWHRQISTMNGMHWGTRITRMHTQSGLTGHAVVVGVSGKAEDRGVGVTAGLIPTSIGVEIHMTHWLQRSITCMYSFH